MVASESDSEEMWIALAFPFSWLLKEGEWIDSLSEVEDLEGFW